VVNIIESYATLAWFEAPTFSGYSLSSDFLTPAAARRPVNLQDDGCTEPKMVDIRTVTTAV
jgi:hypothetical protein